MRQSSSAASRKNFELSHYTLFHRDCVKITGCSRSRAGYGHFSAASSPFDTVGAHDREAAIGSSNDPKRTVSQLVVTDRRREAYARLASRGFSNRRNNSAGRRAGGKTGAGKAFNARTVALLSVIYGVL